MRASVVCEDQQCRFGQDLDDIRDAPQACPKCGKRVLTNCPVCGALLRDRSGRCANCGRSVFGKAPSAVRPAL